MYAISPGAALGEIAGVAATPAGLLAITDFAGALYDSAAYNGIVCGK
jgi:hypothetical protein